MKIAILNKYQNKVNRGAETYVSELAKRLSIKHKVDVISNINYIDLLKNKYNLIIPTNGREQVFIVRIVTWLTGAKMMVSGQSGIGLDDRLNLYAFPNAFIALSTKALNWAKKINPLVKSYYIPNGVDLNKFSKSKTQSKGKTIIAVGAFTEQKRHDLVIKAVAELVDTKLIIAGGGGDIKKEIINMGEKMLGRNRFEVVETTNDKMPSLYNKADAFTLASRSSESFGIVLVEAMAAGLPVVATNDSIRKEIVGDAGLFVDPTDTVTYAEALKKALNANWGDKPRKQAKKFDWDIIAKQYEEILNNY